MVMLCMLEYFVNFLHTAVILAKLPQFYQTATDPLTIAYMKVERYERGVFDSFSKRGSALYEADKGERYSEPKNDVLYRICSVSIINKILVDSKF